MVKIKAKDKVNDWYMGADPDMHRQSVVVIDGDCRVVRIAQFTVGRGITGRDAILRMSDRINKQTAVFYGCKAGAVESQEIAYSSKQGANPRSLMMLANISGLLVSNMTGRCGQVDLPTPVAWKGSISKIIHQARICKRMGWKYKKAAGYIIPEPKSIEHVSVIGTIKPSDWKHILDSLGLALWAMDKYKKHERRELILEKIRNERKANS